MALKSLLHDPNISAFLQQIPQNQHVVTLKQLIYIGIKIVSNSCNIDQSGHNTLSDIGNKQNQKTNLNKGKQNKKSIPQNSNKKKSDQKKINKSKSSHFHTFTNKNDRIQSTLLRQISKIRMQLESLTNKVYDRYFDEQAQLNQNEDSFEMNRQKQGNFIQSYGFNHPQNLPTFSPPKGLQDKSYGTNPFLRQKNNFFEAQGMKRTEKQKENKKRFEAQNQPQVMRNRARSNLMHLDDTQVRQALYKQQDSNCQQEQPAKNRQKKSYSLIEKHYQQKKKDQQNYFYQLNVDKQNLKELQKFKESKHIPEASYRDFVQDKPPKIDQFKKKAKSKIKTLVERDRIRYQNKVDQQIEQRNLEQYEYSANELDQNEEDQSGENDSNREETFEKDERSYNDEREAPHREAQEYANSPQAEFEREREFSNQNFGFYESKGQSLPGSRKQKGFNKNQGVGDKIVDSRDEQSSFSQFSQFSMSSNNSRRQIGKISRRRE